MLFSQDLGSRKYRYEQALSFQIEIDIGEVVTKQRLAARNQAPQRSHRHGLIGNAGNFIRPQFGIFCRRIVGGKIDVAVPAVVRASRRQFQFERIKTPFR